MCFKQSPARASPEWYLHDSLLFSWGLNRVKQRLQVTSCWLVGACVPLPVLLLPLLLAEVQLT